MYWSTLKSLPHKNLFATAKMATKIIEAGFMIPELFPVLPIPDLSSSMMTAKPSINSKLVGTICSGGRRNPQVPRSLSSNAKVRVVLCTPLTQSILPPAAGSEIIVNVVIRFRNNCN